MELLEGSLLIAAAVSGFLSGIIVEFFKNLYRKRQLRKSLYREIVIAYFDLMRYVSYLKKLMEKEKEEAKEKGKDETETEEIKKMKLELARGNLESILHISSYKYAQLNPPLFYQLKEEADAITSMYEDFSKITRQRTEMALNLVSLNNRMKFLLELIEEDVIPSVTEKMKSLNEKEKKLLLESAAPKYRETLKELVKDSNDTSKK